MKQLNEAGEKILALKEAQDNMLGEMGTPEQRHEVTQSNTKVALMLDFLQQTDKTIQKVRTEASFLMAVEKLVKLDTELDIFLPILKVQETFPTLTKLDLRGDVEVIQGKYEAALKGFLDVLDKEINEFE